MTTVLWALPAAVGLLTAHTAVNVAYLRRPPQPPGSVTTSVSILLPVRDEAHRVEPCLRSLLAQTGLARWEIVVLDDGSTDATAEVVAAIAGSDPRVRLLTGDPPPPGWLGKPYACHQLAAAANPASQVLVFVDADVVLASAAVAAAVNTLVGPDGRTLDLVCPYPRIETVGLGQRLIQPLLQWSWLTFLPLWAVRRSPRPSIVAAGGQFMLLTRAGYARCGGHAAVRDQVLEDIALARAVKRQGGRVMLLDGSDLATCRMYRTWPELVNGYTKSLWAAFGSPLGAAMVVASLWILYALPAVLAVAAVLVGAWNWAGVAAAAYGAGVVGRVLCGPKTGTRIWPDALGHPLSLVLFGWLVVRSFRSRRRGTLTWKGRDIA